MESLSTLRVMRIILLSLFVSVTGTVYAQPAIPVVTSSFLPGIICTDSIEFNAAFSLDGNSFYFTRSANKRTQLYTSTKTGNEWSTPIPLPFSYTNYSDADPAFSPTGELYFISTRPTYLNDTTKDYDIWKVTRTDSGQWSEPINVKELNSPEDEYYISFTQKGDACFSSSRQGGYGQEDIYFSELINNTFTKPYNMGSTINTKNSEYDPFITANGSALIFTSSGRSDSFGKADLYWSIRTKNGWQNVKHFSSVINTPDRDYCPYISRDNKYFLYSVSRDIKSTNLNHLPAALTQAAHSK
ncbi:TolB-like translocation protein [Ohtaekwangia koreensis]|uniref:WD40-like Beta Propeller Repeat n=1 Tax=Ohtaekwangia koreensis TaxID=688867 RepID=A0A1T5M0D6_9BACT|nr:PD40 domain-containing protein [Ohtaekwangia koreensis]SKC81682.1 WD40-like Beta Propeller Repeat [Ohtaekwangia koreensis]